MGTEHSQFFLDLVVFGVDVVISHDLGVGGPVIQLVGGFGEGVELVSG